MTEHIQKSPEIKWANPGSDSAADEGSHDGFGLISFRTGYTRASVDESGNAVYTHDPVPFLDFTFFQFGLLGGDNPIEVTTNTGTLVGIEESERINEIGETARQLMRDRDALRAKRGDDEAPLRIHNAKLLLTRHGVGQIQRGGVEEVFSMPREQPALEAPVSSS